MKQIAKSILKGLLVIVLFTGGSVVLSTAGVKSVSEAKAAVTGDQVNDYLVGLGYEVLDMKEKAGSEDWECHTYRNGVYYLTTVHVRGSEIIDHTDVPM